MRDATKTAASAVAIRQGALQHLCPGFALATLIVLAVAAAPANAIEPEPNKSEPIRVGFIDVIPDFDTKVTPSDNMLLVDDREQGSELLLFKPSVTALVSDGSNQFSSSLEIQNGNYTAAGLDNYIDWKLEGGATVEVNPQSHFKLRAEFFNTHEAVSTAFSAGTPQVSDRFTTSTLDTSYEYATAQGRGRLVLDAGTFMKNYTNNDAIPSYRNHEERQWGSTFHFRVLPGTDMLLQYRAKDVDYLDDPLLLGGTAGVRDSETSFAYVGATWETSASLTGKFKIVSGYKETARKINHILSDTASWETKVRWEPLTDSIVTLNADRIFREQIGMNSEPDTSNFRYNWEYKWAGHLKSTIAGNYSRNTYLDSNREDQGFDLKVRMDYAYSSWLNMFVAIGHDERKSMLNGFDFRQQTFMLGIAASLERLLSR